MNKLLRFLLLLLTFTIPVVVYAQETDKHPIDKALGVCLDKDPSTSGQVRCLEIAYKQWDLELNKNYQTFMSKLKPASKPALKAAQLSWIAYRDSQFKWIDSIYDTLEGSMYVTMRVDEKVQLVAQRARTFANWIQLFEENHPYGDR